MIGDLSACLVAGDSGAWLGDHTIPIVARAGSPALTAIVLSAATGQIIRGAGGPRRTGKTP